MITKEDLQKYKQFKNVLSQGVFNLKGEAMVQVASLFVWFEGLQDKIIKISDQQSISEGTIKTIEEIKVETKKKE